MMNKFILSIFLIFLFTSNNNFSQTAGYLGKRNIVKYQGILGLRNDSYDFFDFFRYHQAAEYEYILNRKSSITVNTQFYQLPCSMYGYMNYRNDYVNFRGNYNLLNREFGIGYKSYRFDWLAPIGNYYQYMILISKYEILSYDEVEIYNLSNDLEGLNENELINEVFNSSNKTRVIFGFTIGKQRVFFDRIIFDYGIQMGWVFGSKGIKNFSFVSDVSEEPDYGKIDISNYERSKSDGSLFRSHFFNFKIGVGIILF